MGLVPMSPKTRPRDLIIPVIGDSLAIMSASFVEHGGTAKNAGNPARNHYEHYTFQLPTRLAAGLGPGSVLSLKEFAPFLGPPHPLSRISAFL